MNLSGPTGQDATYRDWGGYRSHFLFWVRIEMTGGRISIALKNVTYCSMERSWSARRRPSSARRSAATGC